MKRILQAHERALSPRPRGTTTLLDVLLIGLLILLAILAAIILATTGAP